MDAVRLELRIDFGALQARTGELLWRCAQMTAYGLAAYAESTELCIPDSLLQVAPRVAVNDALRSDFQSWVLTNGARQLVETLHSFLDDVRAACAIFSLGERESFTREEYLDAVERKQRRFHRLGFPQKIRVLRDEYRLPIRDLGLIHSVESLNQARNCLVHRLGFVANEDLTTDGAMEVLWRDLSVVAGDGVTMRDIGRGEIVRTGECVGAYSSTRKRRFRLRERVRFDAGEFGGICFTAGQFIRTLIAAVRERFDAAEFDHGVSRT